MKVLPDIAIKAKLKRPHSVRYKLAEIDSLINWNPFVPFLSTYILTKRFPET
jgi:hypothetical protein